MILYQAKVCKKMLYPFISSNNNLFHEDNYITINIEGDCF